tara:strand:+ start:2089 stop:2328 length:240 start_codon:yes stop_codon:yes gene_type:complete
MKLKKSYLRKIIKEELRGVLLELDATDEDETQHIGGGVSKTQPGVFDYDKGEDEVFEEEDLNDRMAKNEGRKRTMRRRK